ncbi:MAG: hypothetical protein H0U92_00390 [Actinobacteria bacterium]|nr:hypothetical protein [Actinomycetota bacterium]
MQKTGRLLSAALSVSLALSACSQGGRALRAPVGVRATSFRVLYRVERTPTPDQRSVVWEVLTVHRPFLASDLTFDRRPRDLNATDLGPPTSGYLSDVDHLYSVDGALVRRVAGRQPGSPSGDQALLDIAGDAARRGAARIGPVRRIAGRACTEIEFVEPPVGQLRAFDATGDHDDVCVDRGGIVLREQWTLGGRVVQTRTASAFAELPAVALGAALATGNAQDVSDAAAAPRIGEIGDAVAPPTPPNYALVSAVSFFFPRPDDPTTLAYASKVWAFAHGAHSITVEAGAGAGLPWRPEFDRAIRLGARDAAWIVRSDGVEVHFITRDGWVRVRATTSLKALLPYARLVATSWDSSAAVPK